MAPSNDGLAPGAHSHRGNVDQGTAGFCEDAAVLSMGGLRLFFGNGCVAGAALVLADSSGIIASAPNLLGRALDGSGTRSRTATTPPATQSFSTWMA